MLPRYQPTLQTSEEAAKEGLVALLVLHSIESQDRGLGEIKSDLFSVRSRAQQAVVREGIPSSSFALTRGPQVQIPY